MMGCGVDVIVEDLNSHPHCAHGPTLLFESFTQRKNRKKRFYACSACRDRKDCAFYQLETDHRPRTQTTLLSTEQQSHEENYVIMKQLINCTADKRAFCKMCNSLLSKRKLNQHNDHDVVIPLTTHDLCHPTNILLPSMNNKSQAQFLFSSKTVQFLMNIITKLGFNKILCIGCPRLHECIVNDKKCSVKSFLLDIDQRYEQFFSPEQFGRYNMFNHHFFHGNSSREKYISFLQEASRDQLLIVIDPPFGGLVNVLAQSLRSVTRDWCDVNGEQTELLNIFWIFPYFMEPRIVKSLPLIMIDYQVDYENHPFFKQRLQRSSPVRIFTNVPADTICLPAEDGYRFCTDCKRYVAKDNRHCENCKACTSKDGRPYVHCESCNRCVKQSWKHCSACNKCFQLQHDCDKSKSSNSGCYSCGQNTHKRRQCPVVNKSGKKRKKMDAVI